jgi:dolichol-phosphate mannosyltransferase
VIAPLSDDADIVEAFVLETTGILRAQFANYELVLVDDGSTDDTVARVTRLLERVECVRLIRCSRRFGTEVAISAGLDTAIGDFVVVALPEMDPPALIPEMVERSRRDARTIVGVRTHRDEESFGMRIGVRFFYWYCNRILKFSVPRNSTYFRVLSRQAVNAVAQIKDRMRFLRILSVDVGFPVEEFRYEPIHRRRERRRRRLVEAIDVAVGIVVSNSTHPLRVVTGLGLVASGLNLLYMLYVVAIYLFKHLSQRAGRLFASDLGDVLLPLPLHVRPVRVHRADRRRGPTRPLYHTLEERNSSVVVAHERRNVATESARELHP